MKKAFTLLLILAMLLSALAAADAADLVGVWYLVELSNQGLTFAPADLGMSMTIELREDGTAHIDSNVQGGTGEGAWSVDGDAITITDDAGVPMNMTLQDGRLVGDADGLTMTFTREEPDAAVEFVPAAEIEAAVEDFEGDWTAEWIGMDGAYLRTPIDLDVNFHGRIITINGSGFDNNKAVMDYADGKLSLPETDDESGMDMSITATLLEDGMMALCLDGGDDGVFTLYMDRN